MVPNTVVLNAAVVPLREPDARRPARALPVGMTPLDVQELLDATRRLPRATRRASRLEELDGDEVVVRIAAMPENAADGPRLADEVLERRRPRGERAAPA